MGIIFEEFRIEILILIIILLIVWYKIWISKYNYWKNKNVPFIIPSFPFGNMGNFFLSKKFIGYLFKDFYFQLKGHKYGGIYSVTRPGLILRDPEIIKQILTKDFNYFTGRGNRFDEKNDPLSAHLFNLNGDRWRCLRIKLTPTFTSGKMKNMFHLMKACSKELEKSFLLHAENEDVIELKDFMTRFGTDVIGSCAFGLDIDSINNPNSEFNRITKELFNIKFRSLIFGILREFIPGFKMIMPAKMIPKETEDFFFKIVNDTVEFRERTQVKRNDFLDLLIQLRNKGSLEDESGDKENLIIDENQKDLINNPRNDIVLTNQLMTAQCFVFFIAGFETSSTTLSFCLYELSLNKIIQNKLQKEIDTVLLKYNNDISYESLKEMKYMDQVIQETLRKYPPLSTISRECTTDYLIKDTNLKIPKGIRVTIPLYGIHYDPEYYPEPERFDPERFTDNAKQARHNYTWLPFGEGPRNCIGMRFGLLQVKCGLTVLLSNYNFDRTLDTQVPIQLDSRKFFTAPKQGIKLKVSKRSK